ncbi:MAG: metallophosphoesterase [Ruminococcaceae bacterium]|nr:metallophosphoesterase [Oscillospiraceae bacterium]
MSKSNLPEAMLCAPTVFAVGDVYKIFMPFTREAITWILVGDRRFCDHSNGILRSTNPIHQVEIPMELLDAAGEYTVVYRAMVERKPYFPVSEDEVRITFAFRPVRGDRINIYHISDTHNMPELPGKAGSRFGDDLDLLVLNGDIPNHSGSVENFYTTFEIASEVTGGHVPVVFARGNHDTRGLCAEKFAEYTPTHQGHTYYTFRLGKLWGMVLDCGEDKDDSHEAYAHTVCFHDFRLEETDFIRRVIRNKAAEYEAEGVEHRMVICHIPFTYIHYEPFNIEQDIFCEWTRLMREEVKPELFLFGHYHRNEIWRVGSEYDSYGQPCDAVIGGKPVMSEIPEERAYTGTALTLSDEGIHVVFNDHQGNVVGEEEIARRV